MYLGYRSGQMLYLQSNIRNKRYKLLKAALLYIQVVLHMEYMLGIECGSSRACLGLPEPFSHCAVISVCAAPMVQHVRKIALNVIKYTISNIYVKIFSICLQSPTVKRWSGSLFQPETQPRGHPRLYAELLIPSSHNKWINTIRIHTISKR